MTAAGHLPYLDADAVRSLAVTDAVDALERALLEGLDPAADPPRTVVSGDGGQLLVMPSSAGGRFSVKAVCVAPAHEGTASGPTWPRIQGIVVIFDPTTLAPAALVDGAALTSVRTPAVSALAVRHLARPDARRLVVFGSGPQAEGHIAAMRAVRPVEDVVVVGRHVGSHQPDVREVDGGLVRRSRVVVEEPCTALREAGDLVLAGVTADDVTPLGDVVRRSRGSGSEWEADRPTLVKTVGMAWEDAVVAAKAVASLA